MTEMVAETSGTAAADQAEAAPRRRTIDVGRLTFVPLAVVLLGLALGSAGSTLQDVLAADAAALPHLVVQLLTGAFYVLIIVLYLRRGAAKATNPSRPAKVAAITGTWLPLALPLAGTATDAPVLLALANALLVVGLAGAFWSLRTLGRSFSVMAQARTLVTSGPYRVVRHPLYSFELVAGLGLVAATPGIGSVSVWLAILGLQLYRTVHEERILESTLPEYTAYRVGTYRLVPGLV